MMPRIEARALGISGAVRAECPTGLELGGAGFVVAGTSIAARRTKAARASTRPVETSA
ncbi:MAG: hypothetical protein IPI67_07890 [Myxococcales bacterium]|nr:hypothetical protein [Myxococcales bacterium]